MYALNYANEHIYIYISHPGTDQAQPCLASVGNQSWAAGQGDMAAGVLA